MDYGAKRNQGSGISKWGSLVLNSWCGREEMNEAYGEEAYEKKSM